MTKVRGGEHRTPRSYGGLSAASADSRIDAFLQDALTRLEC
ncbi:hypothetical protein [Kribbella pittospori]|nr:hypothetical protein [Kribbella pittospori]